MNRWPAPWNELDDKERYSSAHLDELGECTFITISAPTIAAEGYDHGRTVCRATIYQDWSCKQNWPYRQKRSVLLAVVVTESFPIFLFVAGTAPQRPRLSFEGASDSEAEPVAGEIRAVPILQESLWDFLNTDKSNNKKTAQEQKFEKLALGFFGFFLMGS